MKHFHTLALVKVCSVGLCSALVVSGCSSKISRFGYGSAPNTYVVQKNDTLSKIGQRFGVNWKDIARKNGLSGSYTIYPGQRLHIGGSGSSKTSNYQRTVANAKAHNKANNSYSKSIYSKPKRTITPRKGLDTVTVWKHPVNADYYIRTNKKGSVQVLRYVSKTPKDVIATQLGKVFHVEKKSTLNKDKYVVMVKHSNIFISLYDHLETVSVKPGDFVRVRQKIGTTAYLDSAQVYASELHMYKNKKHVNPLEFLKK